jgi:hypothetical protein
MMATPNGQIGRIIAMHEKVRYSPEEISRKAAQECSPRRQPWVSRAGSVSPGWAKETFAYIAQ